jgi:hypothetical protein
MRRLKATWPYQTKLKLRVAQRYGDLKKITLIIGGFMSNNLMHVKH